MNRKTPPHATTQASGHKETPQRARSAAGTQLYRMAGEGMGAGGEDVEEGAWTLQWVSQHGSQHA